MAEINIDADMKICKDMIFHEVAKGNLAMVQAIGMKHPGLLNSTLENGGTFLHLAAYFSKSDVIEWLLSDEGRAAGFSSVLTREDMEKYTALHQAAIKSDLQCFAAIVYGCKEENGERMEMLNSSDGQGCTVLHLAVTNGKIDVVKWILFDKERGGRAAGFNNVLAKENEKGMTALHFAAEKGNLECFVAIVEGCNAENGERQEMLNAVTSSGATVLHFAALHRHYPLIKWLLSKGRDHGFTSILTKLTQATTATALQLAALLGQLDACKVIVEGCMVENGEREEMLNGANGQMFTALHLAAYGGHTSIVSWLLSNEEGGGRTWGFNNVFARTEREGATALHLALRERHLEICKAIVEGCKVENGEREQMLNAVDKQGSTVLHWAASFHGSDIVAWLLSQDADGGRANGLKSETITAVAKGLQSPLHCAALSGFVETLRALLSGCTVGERLKLFLAVDRRGWSALHYAAQYGRPGAIRELLLHHEETKMIVDHRDHRGMTALHRVVLDGGFDEESKNEWKFPISPDDPNRAPREEVVAALLIFKRSATEEKEGQSGVASSTDTEKQQQQQEQQEEEQQAAFIDVNLGLKIEE